MRERERVESSRRGESELSTYVYPSCIQYQLWSYSPSPHVSDWQTSGRFGRSGIDDRLGRSCRCRHDVRDGHESRDVRDGRDGYDGRGGPSCRCRRDGHDSHDVHDGRDGFDGRSCRWLRGQLFRKTTKRHRYRRSGRCIERRVGERWTPREGDSSAERQLYSGR